MEERLQKILAQAAYGSRRACEDFILEGRVTVNGKVAELGQKADPRVDRVAVDGSVIKLPEALTYVALHKPRGVISSAAAQDNRQTVRDLVSLTERLYPVGRLDVDSEGLILLTNDGELTEYLTHPRYESEKEYRVLVRGDPDEEQLNTWRRGVVLEGKRTAPAQVRREDKEGAGTWLRVIMHEGRKHQIRDIGATLGLPVRRLVRVRMGTLRLGNLAPGDWRELKPGEVEDLRAGMARVARPGKPKPQKRPRPRRGE
jgi:23S rRNA pseudouridine2605 synthase